MRYIGNSIIKDGSIEPTEEQIETGANDEVYEVLRVERCRPLFLSDHLDRFHNSMRSTGRTIPHWVEELPKLIEWLIVCTAISDGDIRIVASADGTLQGGFVETLFPTKQMYADGVDCELLPAEREMPRLKIYHSQMRDKASKQQDSSGAYESILVNRNGQITEGSRSNVYFVDTEGVIHTAPDGTVLDGIMRKKIVGLCSELGIRIVYECTDADKIDVYSSCFLSSTPMRILPIRKIGNKKYATPNATINRLMEAMHQLVERQIEKK